MIYDKSVIVFSHNDLDGAGCVILGKLAFRNCKYKICNYNNIDKKVLEYINDENNNPDYIFITDITINEETISRLNNGKYRDKYFIIDHHDTRKELHNNKNIFIFPTNKYNIPNCGTNLFLEFLSFKFGINFGGSNNIVNDFVDTVRYYDTWMWKEEDYKKPLFFNFVFTKYGYFDFVNIMTERLSKGKDYFPQEDMDYAAKEYEKMLNYYQTTKKYITNDEENRNVGYMIAEDYISIISDMFLDEYKDVDYLYILNLRKGLGSIRTAKDNIHVGELVEKKFNGGGHPKAGGFTITDEMFNSIMKDLTKII